MFSCNYIIRQNEKPGTTFSVCQAFFLWWGCNSPLGLERHYKAKTRENEKAEYKFISCNKGLADQFEYFINRILPECVKESIPLEEIAVLLSYNNDCTELALKCIENNIPYYISKHSFERTDFIKWLEICSKWINNNEEILFSEIYKYWEKLVLDHRNTKYISENDRILMKSQFLSVLLDSREYKSKISDWISFVIDSLKISELLIGSEIMPDEWENIGNLLKEVKDETYSDYDTSKFSKIGKPSNQITISTRHSSKGLEFEVVVMMGMEEGHFPSWKALKNSDELNETKGGV